METFPLVSMVQINQARNYFLEYGEVPDGLIPEMIVRSWHRSQNSGVSADRLSTDLPVLSGVKLTAAQQAGSELLLYSRPVMENLFGQIRHTSSMVILADTTGAILHSLGDPKFVDRASKVSLQPGGVWAEDLRGTNAIGTSLVEKSSVVIHRTEHFALSNHFLTCSASPIIDPYGHIKGVLDLSSESRAYQQHSRALVCISTQQIENMMFSRGFEEDFVLHLHRHPQFIGTFYEGIVVFSQQGRLIAANRSALLQLGIDRYQLDGMCFADLFDLGFDRLCGHTLTGNCQPVLELRSQEGKTFFARVKHNPRNRSRGVISMAVDTGHAAVRESGQGRLRPRLEDLSLGDAKMQRMIDRARKVLKHNIPILIEGESGTGKELFAKALHHASERRNSPFIALNCAAIPAELIEAELFGYQEGAFTGARRKGYIGKIRQADGGTVFLDEIGDMPMKLQARLLRVLQERSVTPLGGTTEHPVNISVICATNRKIRDEVQGGQFREDLYYRLNGLFLTLPPLRERTDLLQLAETVLEDLSPQGRQLQLDQEVAALFACHPWPGNIRQLHNLLRTAIALLDERAELITKELLPEDFLEQWIGTNGEILSEPQKAAQLLEQEADLEALQQFAIDQAVEECKGNLSAAARRLGIGRTTLYRRLKKDR